MNYWTICWKCERQIKTKEDCYYLKSRDGNYNFCPECYEEFLSKTSEFIRPERSKREELLRSLHLALVDFHEKMMEIGKPIERSSAHNLRTSLIHNGDWYDCEVCKEILSVRCSEHCGNTVRDK